MRFIFRLYLVYHANNLQKIYILRFGSKQSLVNSWLVLVRLQAAARVVVHVRLARSRLLDVLISNIAVFHNLFLLVAAESFSF